QNRLAGLDTANAGAQALTSRQCRRGPALLGITIARQKVRLRGRKSVTARWTASKWTAPARNPFAKRRWMRIHTSQNAWKIRSRGMIAGVRLARDGSSLCEPLRSPQRRRSLFFPDLQATDGSA